jgi:hypothetical protein
MDSLIPEKHRYINDNNCIKWPIIMVLVNTIITILLIIGFIVGIFCNEKGIIIAFGKLLIAEFILWIIWFCFDCVITYCARGMAGPSFRYKHIFDPWYVRYFGFTTEIFQIVYDCIFHFLFI